MFVACLCGLSGAGCGSSQGAEADPGRGVDAGLAVDAGRDSSHDAEAGTDSAAGPEGSAPFSGAWVWQSNAPNDGDALQAVWTDAPGDAWAVGMNTALRWDGSAWRSFPAGTMNDLQGVWGSGPDDVWAVAGYWAGTGNFANLVHWDGSVWTPVPSGIAGNLFGVWGSAREDVWAVGGDTFTGTTTVDGGTPPEFPEGVILHFDGTAWTVNLRSMGTAPAAVRGSSASDVWAVGGQIYPDFSATTTLHSEGSTWNSVSANEPANELMGVWASSPTQAWAVGIGAMVVWNGSTWTPSADARLTGLRGVWGSSASDVWVVGGTSALHWDGAAWSSYSTDGAQLDAVGGVDRDHVWAVGEHGAILAFDPTIDGTPTCGQIGGQCVAAAACGVGAGHLSGHACGATGEVCCVASSACLGPEAECCDTQGISVPDRPQCNGGSYACVNGTVICPAHP